MNNSQHTTLTVLGMTCGSCVRHVGDALRALDGVVAVEVKLPDGLAVVAHDPGRASVAAMVAALDAAGYRAQAAA